MRHVDCRTRGRWWRRRGIAVGLGLALAAGTLSASGAAGATTETDPPLEPPPAPSVAFYGDSIGYNAESELRAALEPLYRFRYKAAGGADIAFWQDKMVRLVSGPKRPDILLIELGTADAGWDHSSRRFEREVRALLEAVSPLVPCIRWFDLRGEPSLFRFVNRHAVDFNRILARVTAEFPNVEVMHYSHWATLANQGNYWFADRLHHNAAGRRQLALMARQAAIGCDPARTTGPFWDVPDGNALAPAVAWMSAAGIASAYPNGTFRAVIGSLRPPVNRGQALRFLWNLAGSPIAEGPHPWRDGTARLAAPLAWAASTGVMDGFPDGTWRPKRTVTRGQMVAALWRLAGAPTDAAPHPWSDVGAWQSTAFDWATTLGLVAGLDDGTVRPKAPLARGQVAKLLHAFHLATDLAPPPEVLATPSPSSPPAAGAAGQAG